MDTKRKFGGGLLLLAGGFFGRETGAYIWEGLLNLATAGATKVSWSNFPWLNALGFLSFVAGVIVLIWPWLKNLSGRMTLNEEKVISLVNEKIAALPNQVDIFSDASQFQELTTRKIEGLTAILKTAIEENKATHTLCSSLKQEVADIRNRVAFIQPVFERVQFEERKTAAKRLVEHMAGIRLKPPSHAPLLGRRKSLGGFTGARAGIVIELQNLGIPATEIEAAESEAEKKVHSHVKYRDIANDENKFWTDADEKQRFHVWDEKYEAYLNLMRKRGLLDE